VVAALLPISQPKKAAEEGHKPRRLLPKRLQHFKSHTLSDEAAAVRAKTESLSSVVTALEPQQLAKNTLLSVSQSALTPSSANELALDARCEPTNYDCQCTAA
jgi:hypothetical protein